MTQQSSTTGGERVDREIEAALPTPTLVFGSYIREPTKACCHCGETKPATAFRRNPAMRDGLGSWCRPCHLVRTQQWRQEHRERILQARREQYAREHDGVRPYRRKLLYVCETRGPGSEGAHESTIVTSAPLGADE